MQIAFIAPKNLAEMSDTGHYHFLLPQTTAPYYKKTKKFKMLDNGAYENQTIKFEELMKIAKEYSVNEIVIPDFLKDRRRTMESLVENLPKITGRWESIAAVPQGKDALEWIACYKHVIELKGINTICLPKWLGRTRPYIVSYLIKNGLWKHMQFNYHLFGLDYLEELDIYRRMGANIRSVDTSMPFTKAAAGKLVSYFDESKDSRVSLTEAKLNAEQLKMALQNMQVMREIVSSI